MRIIVTGGCGFVGAAVVRALMDRGDQVLVIDRARKSRKIPALAGLDGKPGYVRLEADASDSRLMRAVFREFRPARVFHLCAPIGETVEDFFAAGPQLGFGVAEACADLVDRASASDANAFRLVHATCARAMLDETPETTRHAMATATTDFLESWTRSRGVPAVSCMAPDLFGPFAPKGNVIGDLIDGLLFEDGFDIADDGETSRDWLPVRDFAAGLIAAGDRGEPGGRYEFSVGAERRDIDIAEAICGRLDVRAPRRDGAWFDLIEHSIGCINQAQPADLDPTEAERTLGWRPAGFHAGLESLIGWALRRRAQQGAHEISSLPRAAE